MKAATRERQAGVVHAAAPASRPPACAAFGQAVRPRAASTSRWSTTDGRARASVDGLHRILRAAAPSRRVTATCTRRAASSGGWRASSARASTSTPPPRVEELALRRRRRAAPPGERRATPAPRLAHGRRPSAEEARLLVARLRRRADERRRAKHRQKGSGVRMAAGDKAPSAQTERRVIRSVSKTCHAVSRRRRPSAARRAAGPIGRARHAAAEPDLRRAGRRRQATRGLPSRRR